MSEELRVKLLGPPAAFVGDEPVSGFVSIKAQALLYFLAATGEAHRRDALAALLWSDVPDAAAKKNLRDVLFNLRGLIGPFLIITRHVVGLNPDAPTKIDSQFLLQTLTDIRSLETAPAPAHALQTLAEAADPRQGDFLAGFYAPDAPLFEEWMLAERERLRLELGNALESLTDYSLAFEDYAAAEAYARRQLELDSYRETAHRQLMTALALSDRCAEAVAHYETLADVLWHELGLEPAEKTQELIAKIQAGETIPVTISDRFQATTDNLPEALTPFVGRETELAAIAAQFEAPNSRLLTLHGPGGVGKTRLALEFARRQRGWYAGDIFFIPLASLTSHTNLVTTIATAIGLRLKPNPKPLKQLLQFMQSRQMLLLLDNFEHLKEGVVLLVDMLQAASQLTILVTSRERLHLAAENLFEVSGLRTGTASEESTEEKSEAAQMFEIYAQRVRHDFQPGDVERRAIADLCRLVEGMPLAIELAAAWVLEFSPAEILQQLVASSRLLETEYADVPPRLRSVRASFNYSWGLLSDEEQQALMRLSVFRGGCTNTSVEAVTGISPKILAALVDKSMLTYDPADNRYYSHELIRQLAEKRLQDSGQETATDRNHAGHFSSHAYRAWVKVDRDDDWEAYYKQIGPELGNCRVALKRTLAAGDVAASQQLAAALGDYLLDHGQKEEAVRLLEEALAGDEGFSPPAMRAAANRVLSMARFELGGSRKSVIEPAEKALTLYQIVEDDVSVAHALFRCGYAYFGYDWDRSRIYFSRSLKAFEEAGMEPSWNVGLLSVLEIYTGNLEKACSLLARRRAIHEEQADDSGIIMVDTWLAYIHYFENRLDEAQRLAEKSLQYQKRTHALHDEQFLIVLHVLVLIALAKRQLGRVRALLNKRLRIVVSHGCFPHVIHCFDDLAEWLLLSGHPHQAAFWLGCLDRSRNWLEQPMEPVFLPHYQWLVFEVRDALEEGAYTAAWEKGYTVSAEDALPLALQVVEQYGMKSTCKGEK